MGVLAMEPYYGSFSGARGQPQASKMFANLKTAIRVGEGLAASACNGPTKERLNTVTYEGGKRAWPLERSTPAREASWTAFTRDQSHADQCPLCDEPLEEHGQDGRGHEGGRGNAYLFPYSFSKWWLCGSYGKL